MNIIKVTGNDAMRKSKITVFSKAKTIGGDDAILQN